MEKKTEKKKSTHGGRRKNQHGRPKLPADQVRVLTTVRLRPDHYKAIKGKQTAIIEAALDLFLQTQADKNAKSR